MSFRTLLATAASSPTPTNNSVSFCTRTPTWSNQFIIILALNPQFFKNRSSGYSNCHYKAARGFTGYDVVLLVERIMQFRLSKNGPSFFLNNFLSSFIFIFVILRWGNWVKWNFLVLVFQRRKESSRGWTSRRRRRRRSSRDAPMNVTLGANGFTRVTNRAYFYTQ